MKIYNVSALLTDRVPTGKIEAKSVHHAIMAMKTAPTPGLAACQHLMIGHGGFLEASELEAELMPEDATEFIEVSATAADGTVYTVRGFLDGTPVAEIEARIKARLAEIMAVRCEPCV